MTEVIEKARVDFKMWAGKSPVWENGLENNPVKELSEALPFETREEYLDWIKEWKSVLEGMEKASRDLTRGHKKAQRDGDYRFSWNSTEIGIHEYGWRKAEIRYELTGMYAIRRLSRLKAGILSNPK